MAGLVSAIHGFDLSFQGMAARGQAWPRGAAMTIQTVRILR